MNKTFIYRQHQIQNLRIIDGDTFEMKIDFGMRRYGKEYLRLHNIDVYERRTMRGKQATRFVTNLLENDVATYWIETYDVEGKYGRWLGDIKVIFPGFDNAPQSLCELLRANGFEKPDDYKKSSKHTNRKKNKKTNSSKKSRRVTD